MGLDCSHNAFHGGYISFSYLRQIVTAATEGESSFPPHWRRDSEGLIIRDSGGFPVRDESLDPQSWYIDESYTRESHPGLYEFLSHSDCDGEISPEMCVLVADDLEALLPAVEALKWPAPGHIEAAGGYAATLRRFIDGCRSAAASGEPLEFH